MLNEMKDCILNSFSNLDFELKESPFKESIKNTKEYIHLIEKKRNELTLKDLDTEYDDLSLPIVLSSKAIAYYLPSILINLIERYYEFERHSYLTIFVPPINNMGVVRKSWLKSSFVNFLTIEEKQCTARVLKFISDHYSDYHASNAYDRYWNSYMK